MILRCRPLPKLPARLLSLAVVVPLVLGATSGCRGDDGATADGSTPADGGATPDLEGELTVLAAASLTDAFTRIGEAFEEAHPQTAVALGFGPSSGLREQILDGAPADVYASADPSNVEQVVEAGEADGSEVFATNEMEIAVPPGNPGGVRGLEAFGDDDLFVGLCDPSVPCGELGREVLANAGVTPAPDTEAADVRALLAQVAAGELDAGLVYRTDVAAAGDDVEGIEVPDEDNVTTQYPIAALSASPEPELAQAFVAFVLSAEGQEILVSLGFGGP